MGPGVWGLGFRLGSRRQSSACTELERAVKDTSGSGRRMADSNSQATPQAAWGAAPVTSSASCCQPCAYKGPGQTCHVLILASQRGQDLFEESLNVVVTTVTAGTAAAAAQAVSD